MADVFPVIPEELPAQVAESIGRSPEFVFHDGRQVGQFPAGGRRSGRAAGRGGGQAVA